MRRLFQPKICWGLLGLLAALSVFMISCGGDNRDTPREVVIKLFGAMERNDRPGVEYLLDIPSLMARTTEDYALNSDSARVWHSPDDLLDDLVNDGKTKSRWFAHQRIVGRTEIHDDTAFVEISFIDKTTDTQYYNKFGLHLVEGRWKIYGFRTLSGN